MVNDDESYKNTKVFYRFLPMFDIQWDNIRMLDDKKTLYVRCLQDFEKGREHVEPSYWQFQTDGLFYNVSQEDVFQSITEDGFFDRILEGNSAVILSYGQTYSGKSLTTFGLENTFEDRGLIPRIIETLFSIKEASRKTSTVCVSLSFIETNRNYVLDLLNESENEELLDMNNLKNVSVVKVQKADDAMKLIFRAEARKTMKPNGNYNSNMANCVVTFTVIKTNSNSTDSTLGKLHVVDLCGADTVGNVSCFHKNGFEIGNGNLAKTQLEQFVLVLHEQNRKLTHVKQRMCVIVNYLKGALNRYSLLRFVGHLRTPKDDLMVTLSMLRFGQLVSGLEPQKLRPQIFQDNETHMKAMAADLTMLRKELDLNSMMKNENLSVNLSQDRVDYMEKLAQDYLHNKNGEIVILNTTDAILAMKIFKNLFNKIEYERNNLAEQIKKKEEETAAASRSKEIPASPSKVSRKSSMRPSLNSSVSLTKSKRSNSKKMKKRDSKETASIMASTKPDSLRNSRNSIGKPRRRTSKRRSTDSSLAQKSEDSKSTQDLRIPEDVPTHETAWATFIEDPDSKYNELKLESESYDLELADLTIRYNVDVKKLQEIHELLMTRQEEAYKALLLSDLECTSNNSEVSLGYTELEMRCEENFKQAQAQMVLQKEKVLTLQAELKLLIETKNKIKSDINEQYNNYCKEHYSVLIPDLNIVEALDTGVLTSEKTQEVESGVHANESENKAVCKKVVRFNQLKRFMRRELEKWTNKKYRNQKWIQSCKLLELK